MKDIYLLYIWLSGILPALLLEIYWFNFKEEDGRTVIDLRKILIIICGALIANWAIVCLYLWCAGMNILGKLGEVFKRLCDFTFYSSGPPKDEERDV